MPKKPRPNPEHVFEGTTITLAVKVEKGTPREKKAKFLFTKVEEGQESQLPPIEVDVSSRDKEIGATLQVPEVGDAADSYRLFYALEIGGKKLPQGEVWVVWREAFTISTKRDIDGTLTTIGCPVLVVSEHGGKESRQDMPFSGTRMLALTTPGPFHIDIQAPYKLKQWTAGKDKGKERELEYEVAPSLVAITSPASSGTIRRYVNDERNAVEIEFKTTAHSGSPAVPDQDVFFEVVFKNPTLRGKGSEPNGDAEYAAEATVDEAAGAVTITERGGRNGDESTWKGHLKSDNGGRGKLVVYLGKGGGETCEIKLGSTDTCEDASLSFESWRRLYVKYWHTGTDLTKDGWLDAKRAQTTECYQKGFIDIAYEPDGILIPDGADPQSPAEVKLKESWLAQDRSGWYPGSEFELKPERILVLNTEGDSWKNISAGLVKDLFGDKDGRFINVMLPDHAIAYGPFSGKVTISAADLADDAKKKEFVQSFKGKEALLFHKTGLQAEPHDPEAHFDLLPTKNWLGKKLQDASVRTHSASFVIKEPNRADSEAQDLSESIFFAYDKKEKQDDKLVRGHVRIVFPDETKTFMLEAAKELKPKVEELAKVQKEKDELQQKWMPLFGEERKLDKEVKELEKEIQALLNPEPPTEEDNSAKIEEKSKTLESKKQAHATAAEKLKENQDAKGVKARRSSEIQTELLEVPKIELTYNVLMATDSPAAGISNGRDAIVIERMSKLFEESKWKELNNTICHEIGHAIGMAHGVTQLQPGNKLNRFPGYGTARHEKGNHPYFVVDTKAEKKQALHPRWYVGRGHTGTHCAEGIGQSDYDKWGDLSGVSIKNIKTFKCVIYGQSTLATPVAYCDNCLKILRAMEVWTGEKEDH